TRIWWGPAGPPRMVKRPSGPVRPPSVVPTTCTWAWPTGCWFAPSVTRTATLPPWAWAVNAVAASATAVPAAHRTSFDGEGLILTLLSDGEKATSPDGRSRGNRFERSGCHDPLAAGDQAT